MPSSDFMTARARHFRYRVCIQVGSIARKSMQAPRLCLVEVAGSPCQASRRQAYLFYSCNGLFQQWFTNPQATFAAKLVSIFLHFMCVLKPYQVPTDTARTVPCPDADSCTAICSAYIPERHLAQRALSSGEDRQHAFDPLCAESDSVSGDCGCFCRAAR